MIDMSQIKAQTMLNIIESMLRNSPKRVKVKIFHKKFLIETQIISDLLLGTNTHYASK